MSNKPINQRDTPVYLFSHHKVGSRLTTNIFDTISTEYGWRKRSLPGYVEIIPKGFDVLSFKHSQVDLSNIKHLYHGIHFIRDPRDIIVSGFLYHQRTDEKWCVNEDFSMSQSIQFPQVPYSQQWRSQEWKERYLESLGGQSYQNKLKALSPKEGLRFEMNHYGKWTIEDITKWDYRNPNVLELRFEDLMTDMENTVQKMFAFCHLSDNEIKTGLQSIEGQNPQSMTDEQIKNNLHISSRSTSKWQTYFDDELKSEFIALFGNVLIDLGYEKDYNW